MSGGWMKSRMLWFSQTGQHFKKKKKQQKIDQFETEMQRDRARFL